MKNRTYAVLPAILTVLPALAHAEGNVNDKALLQQAVNACPADRDYDTITVSFIGDVMLHQAQIDGAYRGNGTYDFSGYFSGITVDLDDADLAVANMEFTLAGEPYTGYPSFSAPDAYAEYMAECGVDIFLTANNHILDKGEKGLLRTLATCRRLEREFGIKMTGSAENADSSDANYPLLMNVDGLKIAIINFTYGTNAVPHKRWPGTNLTDRTEIGKALTKAENSGAGLTIALPHWGNEYETSHAPSQEELARWLAANGADLIVGSHPHVVQDTDMLEVTDAGGNPRKVPVIYSLGNAISNMSAANTQIGLLLNVHVARDCWGSVSDIIPEYVFLWSSLPGRLKDRHCTVKVKDYIGKEKYWRQPYEYRKMVNTYLNIKALTGIED